MAKRATSADHFQTVVSHLKNGGLKLVYYLYGQEEFYLDRLVDKFSSLLPAHEKDFNFDLLFSAASRLARVGSSSVKLGPSFLFSYVVVVAQLLW